MDMTQHRLMQRACLDFSTAAGAAGLVAALVGITGNDLTVLTMSGVCFFGAWWGDRQAKFHGRQAGPILDEKRDVSLLRRFIPHIVSALATMAMLFFAISHVKSVAMLLGPIPNFIHENWDLTWSAAASGASSAMVWHGAMVATMVFILSILAMKILQLIDQMAVLSTNAALDAFGRHQHPDR